MQTEKSPDQVARWLHPTKGWRKGAPTTMRVVAIEKHDGTREDEHPKPKRPRTHRGMWTGGNGRKAGYR